MSLRKAFLHFLQAKAISIVFKRGWSVASSWHSGQSNHLLQHGARTDTCAFNTCLHMANHFLPRVLSGAVGALSNTNLAQSLVQANSGADSGADSWGLLAVDAREFQ